MYNLLQILGALHYCHSVGVVHKDVKLENILLDKNNNIKITDFGLGDILQTGKRLYRNDGSPAYKAPEILW